MAKNILNKEREPVFDIAVGSKGIGKTYQRLRLIKQYIKGNPKVGLKPRKMLILDVNNEYQEFRPISADIKSIKMFVVQRKIECRRITPFKNGTVKTRDEFTQDLNNVMSVFMGGGIMLEDLTLIVGDATSLSLVGALATIRHRDVDVFTNFQSISKFANPKFKSLKNILRLHHTQDSCQRSNVKNNLEDDYVLVRIGEIMVDKRFDIGIEKLEALENQGKDNRDKTYQKYENEFKRFFCVIDFDNQKIHGIFNRNEYREALQQYLQEEKRTEIDPLVSFKDIKTGKPKYTFTTAIEYKTKKYMRFYGNKK